MESNKRFEIVLDKDIRKYKDELDQYLQENLKHYKTFCFDTKKVGIDEFYDEDAETKIFFTKPNKVSIYYSCIGKNDYEYVYVLGLARDPIIQTSNYLDKGVTIKPEAAFTLNTKCNAESNLIFAKDCDSKDIVLLLKINCNDLSDKECAVLEAKNHILINEDNKKFINFGSVCQKNKIALLRNIRNFISNVIIKPDSEEYIHLLNVNVPKNFEYKSTFENYQKFYDKIITNIDQETEEILFKNNIIFDKHETNEGKHKYCMLCGSLIEDSYENEEELKSLVGDNPKKCSHCVEEILMSYFQSKVLAPYTNKSHLFSDFEDKSVASFYFKLLNDNGVLDKGHKFRYVKSLKDYGLFFEEIPEDYQLETLDFQDNVNYSNIGKVISGLDKETITGDFELLDGYKQRLSNNYLTEEEGWIIRDILIDLIKMGYVSNIKQVSKRLKRLINNFDNLNGIDLFLYEMNSYSEDSENDEESIPTISLTENGIVEVFSPRTHINSLISQHGK